MKGEEVLPVVCARSDMCPYESGMAERSMDLRAVRESLSHVTDSLARLETRMEERDRAMSLQLAERNRATQLTMGVLAMIVSVLTWLMGHLFAVSRR